jgi:uncharacterized protein YecA (UPF0149 family)
MAAPDQGHWDWRRRAKIRVDNAEDFILLNCESRTEEDQAYYEESNAKLRFFRTSALKENRLPATDFPSPQKTRNLPKMGRNQLCPCGSGKKYKRCHGRTA